MSNATETDLAKKRVNESFDHINHCVLLCFAFVSIRRTNTAVFGSLHLFVLLSLDFFCDSSTFVICWETNDHWQKANRDSIKYEKKNTNVTLDVQCAYCNAFVWFVYFKKQKVQNLKLKITIISDWIAHFLFSLTKFQIIQAYKFECTICSSLQKSSKAIFIHNRMVENGLM